MAVTLHLRDGHRIDLEELIEALPGSIAAREVKKLREFATDVLAEWSHGSGLDGFEIQELGVKHGLLYKAVQTKPCAPGCACAEFYTTSEFEGGVTCYRKIGLVTKKASA